MRLTSAERAGAPDESLIEATRSGDNRAYAELWSRHSPAALVAARSITRQDPDDLVAEAFERILKAIREGRGPSGAFRPYLLVTVRNAAISRNRRQRENPLDDADDIADETLTESTLIESFEHSAVASAFRSLPDRWQQVLWYSEVENMPAEEVGLILGVAAQNVPTLAYRAREGLRQAWIQAHLTTAAPTGEHRWVLEQLGRYARDAVTESRRARIERHLAECADCAAEADEARKIGSTFALVLLGLLLGGGATAYAAWTGVGVSAASAATGAGSGVLAGGAESGASGSGATHVTAVKKSTSWTHIPPIAAAIILVAVLAGAVGAVAVTINYVASISSASSGGEAEAAAEAEAENQGGIDAEDSSSQAGDASIAPQSGTSAASSTAAATTIRTGETIKDNVPLTSTAATSEIQTATASDTPSPSTAPPAPESPSPSPPATPTSITTVDVGTGGLLIPIFSGTAPAGTTITVGNGHATIASVVADVNGQWTTGPLSGFTVGSNTATFTYTSSSGTSTTETTSFTLTGPTATLSTSTNTGALAIHAAIADGAANSSYAITVNGVTITTVTTDSAGAISTVLSGVTLSQLYAGTIGVHLVDGARQGPSVTVAVPTVTPTLVVDTGSDNTFFPIASGFATPGTTVIVSYTTAAGTNTTTQVVAANDGTWTTAQLTDAVASTTGTLAAQFYSGATFIGTQSAPYTVETGYIHHSLVSSIPGNTIRHFWGAFPSEWLALYCRVDTNPAGTAQAGPSGTFDHTFASCGNGNAIRVRAQNQAGDRFGPEFNSIYG